MYIRGLLEQSSASDPFFTPREEAREDSPIEQEEEDELQSLDMVFSVVSATGESKSLSKEFEKVTTANAHQYIVQAINYRCSEVMTILNDFRFVCKMSALNGMYRN